MDRLIKFRVWDKHYKKMHQVTDLLLLTGEVDYLENPNEPKSLEHFELMQFTGLSDKNGMDIYEGDLLHRHLNVYWKVSFINSRWVAESLKSDSGLWLDANQFKQCEIVGNIYESNQTK